MSTQIRIDLKGDGAWADITEPIEDRATIERIAVLRGGTASGRKSVALLIRRSNGQLVMAETTMALFESATRMILAGQAMEN